MRVHGEGGKNPRIVVEFSEGAEANSLLRLLRAAAQADGFQLGCQWQKLSAEDQRLAERLVEQIQEV